MISISATGRFLWNALTAAVWWGAALLATASLLVFAALASYGFPLDGDFVVYTTVQNGGVSGFFSLFNKYVMGRYSIMILYGAMTKGLQALGTDPWNWNRISAVAFFLGQVGALIWFFRVVLPGLAWPLAIIAATAPLAALLAIVNDPQAIWPGAMYIYGLSFALYVAFFTAFLLFWGGRADRLAAIAGLAVLFFLFVGTHETTLIPMGLFLLLAAALMLNYGTAERPLSQIPGLSRLRFGISVRSRFDRRIVLAAMFALGLVLCLSAWIQLASPSVAARGTYWPAKMDVLEAVQGSMPSLVALLGKLFDPAHPYFIAVFLFFFFAARTAPLRESLAGRDRLLLLLPAVVFLVIALVSIAASLIMQGAMIPRVVNYVLCYGYFAVACMAIFAAHRFRLPWLSPGRSATMAMVAVAALAAVFWKDARFRTAVEQATGPGYEFSRSVAERVKALKAAKGGVAHVEELARPPYWVQGVIHGPNTEAAFQANVARGFGVAKVVFMPCGASDDPLWCHYRFNPRDGRPPELMPPGQYDGPGMRRQEERLRREKAAAGRQ